MRASGIFTSETSNFMEVNGVFNGVLRLTERLRLEVLTTVPTEGQGTWSVLKRSLCVPLMLHLGLGRPKLVGCCVIFRFVTETNTWRSSLT